MKSLPPASAIPAAPDSSSLPARLPWARGEAVAEEDHRRALPMLGNRGGLRAGRGDQEDEAGRGRIAGQSSSAVRARPALGLARRGVVAPGCPASGRGGSRAPALGLARARGVAPAVPQRPRGVRGALPWDYGRGHARCRRSPPSAGKARRNSAPRVPAWADQLAAVGARPRFRTKSRGPSPFPASRPWC